MDRFWKYNLDHWIFWISTIFFHLFTRMPLIEKAGTVQFLLEIIVRNGLLAAMIYVNLLVLIPRFSQQKKYFRYFISLTACVVGYVLAKNAHDVYLYGYILGDDTKRSFFFNSLYNFSIGLFYLVFSIALQLSKEWYFQRELIRKIEWEKLNTELDYLKAQINPHFLFNSINTIYFQIDKQNGVARETLSRFSDMLRYQLYECNGREIPVEKEINYLHNYVELQRLRRDENYTIMFRHDNLRGFTIAPLLLIPFVENAFKHVSHFTDADNKVIVQLQKTNNAFEMTVLNTKDVQAKEACETGGIGLKNVKRRLELLYNGRHQLDIRETTETFEVRLQLHIS